MVLELTMVEYDDADHQHQYQFRMTCTLNIIVQRAVFLLNFRLC